MKPEFMLRATAAITPLLLAACGGIGDGNGPVSMEIALNGETEQLEVYECLAAQPQALVTFDNGRTGNFARRAQWSSSDESVIRVSDGSIEAGNGNLFVNGALLPVAAGQAELTVRYLDFEDSIPVRVSPNKIELSPRDHTVIQGNQLNIVATGLLQGEDLTSVQDMSGLGLWSVASEDAEQPLSSIVSNSGLFTAAEGVEGRETVTYAVEFCGRQQTVDVNIVDQTLQSIELVRADDPESTLESFALPPDASLRLRVVGHYSGGIDLNLTSAASLDIANTDIVFNNVRGRAVITSFNDVPGQSTEITATFDPDSGVDGDELLSNPVSVQVLDATLEPDSLVISPAETVMLNGSSLQFTAMGRFSGADGEVDWDLTRDVSWTSTDTSILLVSNSNGSRGRAISSGNLEDLGEFTVSALRNTSDAPDTPPTASVIVGAASADDAPVEVVGLTIMAPGDSVSRGDRPVLSVEGELASETLTGSQDLSNLVTWRSSDESVAIVDNSSIARGEVRVLTDAMDQSVTFTATYSDVNQDDDVSDSITLTVNPSPAE